MFCAIAAGEASAHVVAEADHAIAFLDLNPAADGHTLVVPRRHVSELSHVRAEEGAEMFALAARISGAMRGTLAPAVNLHLADGAEAGQDVFHTHLHVIPRSFGDGVVLRFPLDRDAAALEASAQRLRDLLG